MAPEILTEIINDAISWKMEDPKVYTSAKVISFLSQLGAKVIINHEQCSGRWVTEIQVGKAIFVHSSEKRIIN
jgi:hypothetical protein